MSQWLERIRRANESYREGFREIEHVRPPLAILTCMDERIHPWEMLGLQPGDAHILRNAGGRADEGAIRSLLVSHKMLGSKEWLVIHHTDCGMGTLTNELIANLFEESLESAVHDEKGWRNPVKEGGCRHAQYHNFMPFSDLEQSVVDDVRRLRFHPLVSPRIPIYGMIYDVATGALREVPEAMEIGAARA